MEISLFTRSIMGIKFVLPEMCSTAALGCDPLSDQNAANAQPDCTPRVGVILNPRTKDRLEIIRGIRAGEGSAPLPSRGSQPCCLISLESRALSGERSHRSCSCTAALGCDPLSDQNAANAQPDCTPRVDVILSPRTKARLEIIRGIRAGEDRLRCCLAGADHIAISLLDRKHCQEKGTIYAVIAQPPSAVHKQKFVYRIGVRIESGSKTHKEVAETKDE